MPEEDPRPNRLDKMRKTSQHRYKSQSYWYRFHCGECPVCGRDASYKVRVYGRKPKKTSLLYKQLSDQETYDHCEG